MSRIPTDVKDPSPIPEELPYMAVTTRSGTFLDPRRPEMAKLLPVSLDEVVQAQGRDKLCRQLRKELDEAQPTRLFLNDDGILCRKGYTLGEEQVVVPECYARVSSNGYSPPRWVGTQGLQICSRPYDVITTGHHSWPTCMGASPPVRRAPRIVSWSPGKVLP